MKVNNYSFGNYFEVFEYRFNIVVRVHADEVSKGTKIEYFPAMFDGVVRNYNNLFEYAKLQDLFIAMGVNVNVNNASISNVIRDLQTFGDTDIAFFEYGSGFSKQISISSVQNDLDNPPAPGFSWKREFYQRINDNVFMSGQDPTTGLSIIDSTYASELNDADKVYFALGIDSLGVPGYYYLDSWSGVLFDSGYKLWDVQLTVPLMLTITTNYNIDTGTQNTRQSNTDGTAIVLNSTFTGNSTSNQGGLQMEIANALHIPIEWVVPFIFVIVIILFMRRR